MAFPTTLTDTVHFWQSGQGRNRPWISSAGNVYFITNDGTTPDLLVVKKATDPSVSFSEVATVTVTGASSQISCLATIQDGDNLHVVTYGQAGNGDKTIRYHVFSMSSDTFTTSDEDTTISAVGNNAPTASNVVVDIEIRSDGDIILNYTGTRVPIMGTRYHRVYYARREGGTWTVDISLDAGGQFHYFSSGIVRGASDLMHLTWIKVGGSTSDVEHRSLTSGNTLNSVETVNDTLARDQGGANHIVAAPVFYDSGGTERITVIWDDDTANHGFTSEIDDDGTPGAEEEATDNPVHLNTINGRTSTMSLAVDEQDVHVLYSQESDEDIFSDKNSNGGGWGTDTEERDGVDCIVLTTNIYQRGSDIVLAFVYANTNQSTVRYDEIVIRSVGGAIEKNAVDTLDLETDEVLTELLSISDRLDSVDLEVNEGVPDLFVSTERVDSVDLDLGEDVDLLSAAEAQDNVDLEVNEAPADVLVPIDSVDAVDLALAEGITDLLGLISPQDLLDLAVEEGGPQIDVEGTAQDNLDLEVIETLTELLGLTSSQDDIDLAVVESPGQVEAGITAEDEVDLDIGEDPTDLLGLIEPVDTTGLSVDEVTEILSLAERLDTLGISISEVTDLLVLLTQTDILDLVVSEDPGQIVVGIQTQDTLSLAVTEVTDLLGLIERSDTVGLTIIEGVPLLFVQANRDDLLNLEINESVGQVKVPIQTTDVLDLAVVEGVGELLSLIERTDLLDLSLSEQAEVINVLTLVEAADILGLQIVEFPADRQIITFEGILVQPITLQVRREARFRLQVRKEAKFTLQVDRPVKQFRLQVRREARFQLEVRREARFILQIEGSGVQQP